MQDLMVTMDIDVFNVPCELVDLRFTSKKGRTHTVERYFLKNGISAGVMTTQRGVTEVADAMKQLEGCKIKGTFYLHFLSNQFIVGFGNAGLLSEVSRQLQKDFVMDLSHRINHLSFGPDNEIDRLSRYFFNILWKKAV